MLSRNSGTCKFPGEVVEVDETFIGGKATGFGKGNHANNKTLVMSVAAK